jgi:ATP-dependent Lon protease
MFVSLVSLLTGKHVRPDVAMTGEITLRGNVLPVGGIKEKLLAAHRAGIKRVVIPERNVKDLVDVPDQARREMEIIAVRRMDELLPLALNELPDALRGVMEMRGEPVPGSMPQIMPVPPPKTGSGPENSQLA